MNKLKPWLLGLGFHWMTWVVEIVMWSTTEQLCFTIYFLVLIINTGTVRTFDLKCEVWKGQSDYWRQKSFQNVKCEKPSSILCKKISLSICAYLKACFLKGRFKSLGPRLSFCPALKRGRPRPLPWRDVRGAAGLERGEPPTGGRRRSPQEPGTPAGGRPRLSGRCSGRCGASPPL